MELKPGITYLHKYLGFIRVLMVDKLGYLYNTDKSYRPEILTFNDTKYINRFYKKLNN